MTAADTALGALLDFYVASGVDCALDETPHNWFEETAARAPPPPRPADEQRREGAPVLRQPLPKAAATAGEMATDARALAARAGSLAELEALLADFEGCALRFSAKNLAFADGNPNGRVMFVGEAPGADEDRIGKPFMGRAGQLLDRMLKAIGLDRSQVYIANVVPWRPPGNRTPTPQEIAICRPFIERQIELAAPEIVVCLGGAAAETLVELKGGILKGRGRWFPYRSGDRNLQALTTLHPAYLLRQPLQKRLAWRDFMALRRALDGKA